MLSVLTAKLYLEMGIEKHKEPNMETFCHFIFLDRN